MQDGARRIRKLNLFLRRGKKPLLLYGLPRGDVLVIGGDLAYPNPSEVTLPPFTAPSRTHTHTSRRGLPCPNATDDYATFAAHSTPELPFRLCLMFTAKSSQISTLLSPRSRSIRTRRGFSSPSKMRSPLPPTTTRPC